VAEKGLGGELKEEADNAQGEEEFVLERGKEAGSPGHAQPIKRQTREGRIKESSVN